jgi:phage shock protein PspC (stress-responsive transcriptional regulator)
VPGDRTVDGGGGARAATTSEGVSDVTSRLSRPRDDRWIAGVCSGLGRRFGLSSGVVRLLFVLSCLLPGPQVLVYIVLWAIMPNE